MEEKKLIIPKGDGTLEMAIASLEIYYKYNDWLPNDLFREKLIEKYPKFKDRDSAFLLHKARTARYFGLIEYLYKNKDGIQGRQGRITVEGKRFYEGYLAKNKGILIDAIMDCIDKYTFGRKNYGIEGNSDVEMPSVLLKASLDLGYISREESIAILYYMHDKEKEYQDVIEKISIFRKKNINPLVDIPEDLNLGNRYGDNKAGQLMREINIFEDSTSKYKLVKTVEEKYFDFIKGLRAKTHEYLDVEEEFDTFKEESEEDKENEQNIKVDNEKCIQRIYYGPPGTGKSYNLSKEILEHQMDLKLIPEDSKEYNSDYVFRTTIYPDYSYYDFIGNIMPIVDGENITYDFKPGIFTLALRKALKVVDKNIPVYLVIEEMSRGNITSIFGDVFQLLDRDGNGVSEYQIDNDIIADYLIKENIAEYEIEPEGDKTIKQEIYLPSNLNIVGTVNTSDQNVFVMDTAFKRRFEFKYIDIDPVRDEKTGEYLNEYKFIMGEFKYSWNDFYVKLNDYIIKELELPEDKQIGQFFIKFDENTEEENSVDEENYKQIQNKLLQYLWEDVHLISMTENKLFKEEYMSFSNVYKDFGNHVNVFNNKLIETLSKENIKEDIMENEPSENVVTYEEG